MSLVKVLEMASATDPGLVRSHNEDSIAVDADIGLAVLADGMGGYNAGEVASGIAVSLIMSEMQQALPSVDPHAAGGVSGETIGEVLLRDKIGRANASIFQAAISQPQYAGMGTTLVAALFYDNRVSVGHIGDSRMYRLRAGQFEQITRDHSLLQEQIDSGMISKEMARLSQNKNLVTRAVGIDPDVEAEIHTHAVQAGDIYLICSDGLNDMVEDEEIGATLGMLEANLPLAATQLVQMANDNGGRDNISVILIKVLSEFPAQGGWFAKFLSWFK
ncbi:MAG: Stp1/IreP family PP2C-type Ser/Thr phosphatase [Pseudomonadota bacterium]